MNDEAARLSAALESTSAAPAMPLAEADDLAVLAPDAEITLAGEAVTVREYTFGEQLRHGALLTELTEAMRPAFALKEGDVGALFDALAAHHEALLAAIALAVDRAAEWVAALSGEDGETLMLTWWRVNQGFFVRRLVLYPVLAAARKAAGAPAGAKSSPSSSTTGTPGAN
jgi:hypothetical protein